MKTTSAIFGLALALVAAAPAAAAGGEPVSARALTAQDAEAYFDGMLPYAMARGDIAGAEIVVVKDGQVLLAKGYGFADVKARKPVDLSRTLFRPGSVSKLFTWTAVMQLVEQKKLDLDADVNKYLDFRVPSPDTTIPVSYLKPVTLRDLMTHTPGFEETVKRLFSKKPERMLPLGAGLKAWVPEQIFPPGEVPAYSNYGAALAGYIVERVSGEKFEAYIERHIFKPLGMDHSTFVQPLPKALAADMSKGYMKASGSPGDFELVWMSPAGALSTTADDMAKFMTAYLDGSGRLLKPETVALMQGEAYQRNALLPGMGLGFYHEDRNGYAVVGHGGDTIYFHSALRLIPDANVGIYYTQNSQGKENTNPRTALFLGFMDRYFPAAPAKPEPTLKTAHADGLLAAGNYTTSRRSDSSFLRLITQQATVSLNADDTLSVDMLTNMAGEPRKWREVKPFVWRDTDGTRTLVATVKGGKVVEIASDLIPQIVTYQRTSMWSAAAWNMPLLIAAFAMLLLTVVFWPLKAILRWRYGTKFPLTGQAAWFYRGTRLVALVDLGVLLSYAGIILFGTSHLEFLDSPLDPVIVTIQMFGVLGIIGTVLPAWNFKLAVFDGSRPWWTKVTDGLNLLACLAFVWFAFHFNLVNFHTNY